jgi:pyridoxal phosphate enzyme (YggS family)
MATPSAEQIAERHDALRARLDAAAARAGRTPDAYRIVAVTKTFPESLVATAFKAGLSRFGENRVQEAIPKIAALPRAEWHLVGHLQSNKARDAVDGFAVIHSVDSLALLRRLDRLAHDHGKRPLLLLQVNVSGEASKSGFEPSWFAAQARRSGELTEAIREAHHAPVVGLMTIAATDADPQPVFSTLRHLRDQLQQTLGVQLPELSMGMSGDAEIAVQEGATLVRIGTALFGPRPA